MISLLTGIDRDHGLRSGLTGYLAAVSAAVGVGEESCTLDLDAPTSAYIALDERLSRHPGRDMALLWDERHGWAFAMETHSGEDLLVLAYLGGELVPSPARVRGFVTAIRSAGGASALPVPPDLRGDRGDLLGRLRRHRRLSPYLCGIG
ncbi:DUF6292 family protein [Amycolatopsis vancoresmycina]|uniref:DUF6292 domain-containing protein n=1 Tax=Amycolatopsis vancoresmycina DSM 44592 TaxID=1292037 RepID=R1GG41_9PSEU|nr:DUF6292 family protein [Amycolatopsis vancoresmycina]EOD70247.1 hypothetical protein H480_01884 [Amycolatopsis vancoresmycina DSM 44592]